MVWPVADVNVYKFGSNKEGRFPGIAPFRVAGFIQRNYSEEMELSNTVPGSRSSIRSVARSIAWRSASALRFASKWTKNKARPP